MSSARPWQIVLIVAALVLAVVSLMYFFAGRGSVRTSGEVTLVDVTTGELWKASIRARGIGIPATNPDTGKSTLVMVSQDGDGRWIVSARDIGAIRSAGIDPKAVDPGTGEVTVSGERPRRLR
jgi:hypothetical protein